MNITSIRQQCGPRYYNVKTFAHTSFERTAQASAWQCTLPPAQQGEMCCSHALEWWSEGGCNVCRLHLGRLVTTSGDGVSLSPSHYRHCLLVHSCGSYCASQLGRWRLLCRARSHTLLHMPILYQPLVRTVTGTTTPVRTGRSRAVKDITVSVNTGWRKSTPVKPPATVTWRSERLLLRNNALQQAELRS